MSKEKEEAFEFLDMAYAAVKKAMTRHCGEADADLLSNMVMRSVYEILTLFNPEGIRNEVLKEYFEAIGSLVANVYKIGRKDA